MRKNIIISFILALILLLSSCTTREANQPSISEKIDYLSGNVTSAKISSVWNSYKKLQADELSSLDIKQKDKIEIMNAIDLIKTEKIEAIKDFLYRPSSLEINELSVEIFHEKVFFTYQGIYSAPINIYGDLSGDECIYYVELYIDYSAQIQAGGYDRERISYYFVIINPYVRFEKTDPLGFYEDINLTPYIPHELSENPIDEDNGSVISYNYSDN